jgi:hypothetical protein
VVVCEEVHIYSYIYICVCVCSHKLFTHNMTPKYSYNIPSSTAQCFRSPSGCMAIEVTKILLQHLYTYSHDKSPEMFRRLQLHPPKAPTSNKTDLTKLWGDTSYILHHSSKLGDSSYGSWRRRLPRRRCDLEGLHRTLTGKFNFGPGRSIITATLHAQHIKHLPFIPMMERSSEYGINTQHTSKIS